MTASRYQNPKGGLNDAGRKHYGVKRPVHSGVNPRRISFAARFGAMAGPERKNGEPTRLLLSLRKWGFSSKAAARAFAAKHKGKSELVNGRRV